MHRPVLPLVGIVQFLYLTGDFATIDEAIQAGVLDKTSLQPRADVIEMVPVNVDSPKASKAEAKARRERGEAAEAKVLELAPKLPRILSNKEAWDKYG